MTVRTAKPRTPLSQAVPLNEYRFEGSHERAFNAQGELSGYTKKEMFEKQRQLMAASQQGQIADPEKIELSRQLVAAMRNDPETHRLVGERLTDAIYMTRNRQGFMRQFMARQDVQMGTIPRFKVYEKNVTAVSVTSPTKVAPQIVRDRFIFSPEFQLITRPFITTNDLNQTPGDVLAEKHIEALEGIMVKEDRLWAFAADQMVGLDNDLQIISGQMTPFAFASARTQLTGWGMSAARAIFAADLWEDIIGVESFYVAIEPVTRYELMQRGILGHLYGTEILTDGFRHREHKVLNRGEFYIVSDPENHGAYMDRDGITSKPIDISTEQIPGRGWVMEQSMAMAIGNSRSVVKGIRV